MSKRRRPKSKEVMPQPTVRRSGPHRVLLVVVAITIVALGLVWWRLGHHTGRRAAEAGGSPAGVMPAAQASTTRDAPIAFEKLKGKWRRPDGGYVIEIRAVEQGGRIDASYFNPKPINVHSAQASRDIPAKVLIELRDRNYPGSTYDLTYDAGTDRLHGVYNQAALGESFDVTFVRAQ